MLQVIRSRADGIEDVSKSLFVTPAHNGTESRSASNLTLGRRLSDVAGSTCVQTMKRARIPVPPVRSVLRSACNPQGGQCRGRLVRRPERHYRRPGRSSHLGERHRRRFFSVLTKSAPQTRIGQPGLEGEISLETKIHSMTRRHQKSSQRY